jgi:hypothetical protein
MNKIETFRAGNIEVMRFDLDEHSVTWKKSRELMSSYKPDGWGLPTLEELRYLYENFHKIKIGNFNNWYYWSSDISTERSRWTFDFIDGVKYLDEEIEGSFNRLRLVRSV